MNATPIYGSGEPKQFWRRMNTDLLPFTCNSSHIHVMLRWRNNYANEASKFLSLSCLFAVHILIELVITAMKLAS